MVKILIPYFGQWPIWMPLFLESCKNQEGFSWVLIGDREIQYGLPDNVYYVSMELSEVQQRLTKNSLPLPDELLPYKLCDYKPAYGLLFSDLIRDSAYWGHTDLDVAYGDLSFLDEQFLKGVDIFSADDRSCGHFQIYRNSKRVNALIFQIPHLEKYLTLRSTVGIDEPHFTHALLEAEKQTSLTWVRSQERGQELKEKYSKMGATIEPNGKVVGSDDFSGQVYYWKGGEAYALHDKKKTHFMYLHWFQWKDADKWKALMKTWEQNKELVLNPNEWVSKGASVKPVLRDALYWGLYFINKVLGEKLITVGIIDKATAITLRKMEEVSLKATLKEINA